MLTKIDYYFVIGCYHGNNMWGFIQFIKFIQLKICPDGGIFSCRFIMPDIYSV